MALFGTDGVRGVAGVDLTKELAHDLAVAAAHVLPIWENSRDINQEQ